MHNNLPNFFYFINTLDKEHIRKLNKKVAIIYRNYSIKYDEKLIINIKNFCRKEKRKFFLANSISLALKLNLDGVYLPSFFKKLNLKNLHKKKKFLIIGSAHSIKEIKVKENQGSQLIFLSPLFKTKKNLNYLDIPRFNLLTLKTPIKTIALGGINSKNINKLNMLNSNGFAAISYFKNNDNILKNKIR
jgi:thiamine-phosphate pyrophosphorylase|tara:strand:+ start:416 stop:982 length:567 start_codon:yes stop_codon:yes gene_type:complete